MMGNENSQLSGLEIEEKAVEITDFWCHYQAKIKDSCRYFSLKSDGSVSVFKGEAAAGPLWSISTPLEKFSNNLLKYRHPCIVRYISAWQQRSTLHLATEYVQPLSFVLKSLTPLQICIGLNNILRALVFLHDHAVMSHNNVSIGAVYVTGDGQWKLGGLQYLCPFSELTSAYLKHSRIHRYDKAVDPNEDSYEITSKVDQYSFAVLVEDVFKGRNDDEVPHLREFKKYCRDQLQHQDATKRPNLSDVLQHNFFNHEFISIYKFLNFLPLKSEDERSEFFSNILDNLKCYDEETVAKQLSGLLLSRLTMLDQTARKDVIPYILKPKNGKMLISLSPKQESLADISQRETIKLSTISYLVQQTVTQKNCSLYDRSQNGGSTGFFSLSVFKEHVKPRLMQLFGVRDIQIRMLLLIHFSKYVHAFSHDELSQQILPELLLGIKDTDDTLVSSTLICLSELVPILGADTVIGGKRAKYFTDGRPNSQINTIIPTGTKTPERIVYLPEKSLRDLPCSEIVFDHSDIGKFESNMSLNERPSPVGGESLQEDYIADERNTNNNIKLDSEDDWSDWDNTNRTLTFEPSLSANDDIDKPLVVGDLIDINTPVLPSTCSVPPSPGSKEEMATRRSLLQKAALQAKKNIVDISELDIKNQKFDRSKNNGDEFDFFADMTPVIEKSTIATFDLDAPKQDVGSKLNFVPDESIDESEAWGENWND